MWIASHWGASSESPILWPSAKVNNAFKKHSQWIPIAVECKVCKPNAFENSLKKIFDAQSIHQAKKIVENIEQALVNYYEELLENEQYKRMIEAEKERKAKESSKKGDWFISFLII